MPLSRASRVFYHWMLDKAIPNNCRKQLRAASEENIRACNNLVNLLQSHRKPLVKVFKNGS